MTGGIAPQVPAPPRPHAPLRCAPAAQERGDYLPGTAAPAPGWLLVEQPGPWGRDALRESRLPEAVVTDVLAAAETLGVRPLLIRRPGRQAAATMRHWAVVRAVPTPTMRWGSAAVEDVAAAALDESAGTTTSDPVYLVCAHSRHNPCCAVRGRPVAHALDRERPGQVWECSHVGGDRFAANVLALPQGVYYGFVSPALVGSLADTHEAGYVVPHLLRGRAGTAPAVQAAQSYARAETGDQRIDAYAPLGQPRDVPTGTEVVLQDGGDRLTLVVRRTAAGPPVALTCGATTLERPPAWELVSLDRQPLHSEAP